MRPSPVPVYVSPGRIVLATLGCALSITGVGIAAAALAAEITYRVLNDHPLYGPIKERTNAR